MKIYKSLIALAMAAITAAGFSACDNEQAYPPFAEPDGGLSGDGTWEIPYNTNRVIGIVKAANSDYVTPSVDYATQQVWVTGYIVGWVNTNISYTALSALNCSFTVPAEIGTNCLIAATPDETDYNNCVVVQLSTTGNVRSNLSLVDHPDNLGRQVSICGNVEKYFGKPGLKSTIAFNWGDKGIEGVGGTPATGDKVSFKAATAITAGKAYGIVAQGGKLAQSPAAGKDYSYLYVDDVTVKDNTFEASASNGFVFSDAGDGSWYISDANGSFLYMEGSFTSFQLSTKLDKSNKNYRWKAEAAADGTWTITNAGNGNVILYSVEHTSFGAYTGSADASRTAPTLYEMEGEPAKLPDLSGEGSPDNPSTPDNPDVPTGDMTFTQTDNIVSGASYALVDPATRRVCVPIAKNYTYGYLLVEDATVDGDNITTAALNSFVITAVNAGAAEYTITDAYGRYLAMDGEHAGSIQLYDAPQGNEGTTWTITIGADGQAKIVNKLTGLTIVWKEQYSNFAPGDQGVMPLLYIKAESTK